MSSYIEDRSVSYCLQISFEMIPIQKYFRSRLNKKATKSLTLFLLRTKTGLVDNEYDLLFSGVKAFLFHKIVHARAMPPI